MPNWMNQLRDILNDLVVDHWMKILFAVAIFTVGRLLGKHRARREWKTKSFMNRLTVSLNLLQPQKNNGVSSTLLKIRTILEADLIEILKNEAAVEELLQLAAKTTEKDPIIHLGRNSWHLLNAVLNEVAEKFADGVLAEDLKMQVVKAEYLLVLTNERAGDLRIQKIRAMMIRADQLKLIRDQRPDLRAVTSTHHWTRWDTLDAIAALPAGSPDQLVVELGLPKAHPYPQESLDNWWGTRSRGAQPEEALQAMMQQQTRRNPHRAQT